MKKNFNKIPKLLLTFFLSVSILGVTSSCSIALAVEHVSESHGNNHVQETDDHCDTEKEESLEELVRITYPSSTSLVQSISKFKVKLEKETFPKSFFISQKNNRSNEPPQEILVFIRTVQLII